MLFHFFGVLCRFLVRVKHRESKSTAPETPRQ